MIAIESLFFIMFQVSQGPAEQSRPGHGPAAGHCPGPGRGSHSMIGLTRATWPAGMARGGGPTGKQAASGHSEETQGRLGPLATDTSLVQVDFSDLNDH